MTPTAPTGPTADRREGSPATKQSTAKVLRAAIVGTTVEYYDFSVYGYMATTIAALYFVSDDPTASLLGTFATFAVAFFLRIPGGIFFGHLGDKYGRKNALSWTILLMVIATAGIGLLPSYYTLGLWATAILVLARCLQGFAAGGEVGGANALVAESAPTRWRATQTTLVISGAYLGSLFASMAALVLNTVFDPQTVLDWAWRIPFLLSIVLGVVGVWIRSQLEDTKAFKTIEQQGKTESVPIRELLRTSSGSMFKIILLNGAITGGYYIISVYAATYLATVGGHSPRVAFTSTAVALILGVLTLPVAGYTADLWGRKPVLLTGSAACILLGFPMFAMMSNGVTWQAFVGQSALFIAVSFIMGGSFVSYVEMLKTSVRYSGIALGNNVANTVLGGTAPFIATYLVDVTGSVLAPAGYFIFTAALTFVGALLIRETKGIELPTD